MIPTEQIIDWLRESAKGQQWPDRLRMREIADRLQQLKQERDALKIDKLNLTSMVEQLEKIRAERDTMAAALKKDRGCDSCKHCDCEWCQEPCDSCRKAGDFPKWEWKGE